MIAKTKPANIIIFHWILIIISIGLLYYITDNKAIIYSVAIYFILSLIFNGVTYLKLKEDRIIITRTCFLFIPISKLSVNINDIVKLSLIDCRDIREKESRRYLDFEANVIVDIITGSYFYKPIYILAINLVQNKKIELEINSPRKDTLRITSNLQEQIKATQNSL